MIIRLFCKNFVKKNFNASYPKISKGGLEHLKTFYIEVYIDNLSMEKVAVKTRKEAEQDKLMML